jgi:hypothetical protein
MSRKTDAIDRRKGEQPDLDATRSLAVPGTGLHIHELKSWPQFFSLAFNGLKRCELRKLDRPFMPGDLLRIREYLPPTCFGEPGTYTGRTLMLQVSCVERHEDFFMIPPGYALLHVKDAPPDLVLI